MSNVCVALRRVPQGSISVDDFELVERQVPEPAPGELLVRSRYLSVDPYMASVIRGRHLSGAATVGDVLPGALVGTVERSRDPRFEAGETVVTPGGWRTYCVVKGDETTRLDPPAGVPPSAYLGILGTPGLTAFAAMTRVLRPQPGETVVVSAAAGAVGSAAGQIAQRMGARVIGVVGTSAKADWVRGALGFDDAVLRNDSLPESLVAACPEGIDALLSNLSGRPFQAVLDRLAEGARVALVGEIAQYDSATILPGPSLGPVVARRATLTGFVVYDHTDLLPRWRRLGESWLVAGQLRFAEERSEGLESAPALFVRLLHGETSGKAIVVVDEAP